MSTMTLQLPQTYVNVEDEEMEYVDGGGTFKIKLRGAVIAGWVASGLTGAALTGVIDSALVGLASTVELGSAGWGTLAAAGILSATAWLAPKLANAITTAVANGAADALKYNGITVSVFSAWWCPNVTLPL